MYVVLKVQDLNGSRLVIVFFYAIENFSFFACILLKYVVT